MFYGCAICSESKDCPDRYTEVSHFCGNYQDKQEVNGNEEERKESR